VTAGAPADPPPPVATVTAEAPADPPPAPATVAPAVRPPPSAAAKTSLAEEVALVERARAALRAGDLAAASAALDARDERFSRGALAEESEVLRVELASASGDRARAERLGRAFLARHPSSPHASRVRQLAGGTAP
jgi:outer membrane protein assembly factor BamD (BamD/ComL family)